MSTVGMILAGVGYIAAFVFSILILIRAFKESVGWGLVSLLVPFGILVFVIKFWDDCKGNFLKLLACTGVAIIGVFIGAKGAVDEADVRAAVESRP